MKPWLSFSLALPAALMVVQIAGAAFAAGFYASPGGTDASSADVGIDKRGNITFCWTIFDPVAHVVVVQMRKRTAAGAFSGVKTISTTGHDAQPPHVAVNGDGDAVLVWQIRHGDVSTTTPVEGRTVAADGTLGPIFTVAPNPGGPFSFEFANPNVAIDASGNATFTWTGLDENQKRRAYTRRRAADGTFGPIHVLSDPGVSNPRMAVNAQGNAVFAWVWNDGLGHNLIQARRLSAAGTLGSTKIIAQGVAGSGGGGLPTGNPQVGLDSEGNALIVWEQPDGQGPCGINGCPKVLSRTLSNSDEVGAVPQTFTTTVNGGFSPQVAMDEDGNAVVTWLHGGLEFRSRSAGGTLGRLRRFTDLTTAVEPVLKGDPAGNTVAVWRDGTLVKARTRSATGTLGRTRRYSIRGQASFGGVLAVGVRGDVVVAWGQSDGLGQCTGGTSCTRVGAAINP
jgi:hypothetical protein